MVLGERNYHCVTTHTQGTLYTYFYVLYIKSYDLRTETWDLGVRDWEIDSENPVKWSYQDKRWRHYQMHYCKMKLISYFKTWINKNLSIEYVLSYSYLQISIPRTGMWSCKGAIGWVVVIITSSEGTSCIGCVIIGYWSYNLAVDNSDSPSIVEQLSQGPSFSYYAFIIYSFLVLWCILCLMPCS